MNTKDQFTASISYKCKEFGTNGRFLVEVVYKLSCKFTTMKAAEDWLAMKKTVIDYDPSFNFLESGIQA